jgi:hypothetical protein
VKYGDTIPIHCPSGEGCKPKPTPAAREASLTQPSEYGDMILIPLRLSAGGERRLARAGRGRNGGE